MNVTVIGAGLAGSEAAWQLAQRGIDVTLREMKPEKKTPAHETEYFAELCCSNSLRSDQLENAVGLLKEELRRLGSLILQCADATRVEAGGALAVDRHGFARMVTEQIRSHPHITVVPGEVTEIPEGEVVIASGPLTSDALAERLQSLLGADTALHFYDAAAPLVTAESVDMDKAWFGSRYDRGTADYVNCPMTEEEYDAFWKELTTAQEAPVHGFEDKMVFEGCMPVEVMARRGHDTLCYGPLKPRGLKDPRTGKEPYAVVQLRRHGVQPGGLPDPPEIPGAAAGVLHDPRPPRRRVFALRRHAPEYLFELSPAAGPVLPAESGAPALLCRPDDRRGGICGVRRLRLSGGGGDRPAPDRQAARRFPPGDRHRRSGAVCVQSLRHDVPAHEYQLRHHAAPGPSGEGEAE